MPPPLLSLLNHLSLPLLPLSALCLHLPLLPLSAFCLHLPLLPLSPLCLHLPLLPMSPLCLHLLLLPLSPCTLSAPSPVLLVTPKATPPAACQHTPSGTPCGFSHSKHRAPSSSTLLATSRGICPITLPASSPEAASVPLLLATPPLTSLTTHPLLSL